MNQDEKVPVAVGLSKRGRNEQRARRMVDELARSGETDAAFARRKGVSPQWIGRWKKRFAAESAPAVGFTEVSLSTLAVSTARIEIIVGGVQLRVREDLGVEHLARLVAALDSQRRAC